MLGSSKSILHLVHPHPVPWSLISSTISDLLRIPIVPYDEWLPRLKDATSNAGTNTGAEEENPALLLIDFFEKGLGAESDMRLETASATEVLIVLRKTKMLGKDDVQRWIAYWMGIGFLRAV